MLSFLQLWLTQNPDARIRASAAASTPHFPEAYVRFGETPLYGYLGWGSMSFARVDNDTRLLIRADNGKRNGTQDDEGVSYRTATYLHEVRAVFQTHWASESWEAFAPVKVGESDMAWMAPKTATDETFAVRFTPDHLVLVDSGYEATDGYVSVHAIVQQLKLTDEDGIRIGVESELTWAPFVEEVALQTSAFADAIATEQVDYTFRCASTSTLSEIPRLLSDDVRVAWLTSRVDADLAPVGLIVYYGSRKLMLNAQGQIVHNPDALNGWVFSGRLYENQALRLAPFVASEFETALPTSVEDWVRARLECVTAGEGNLVPEVPGVYSYGDVLAYIALGVVRPSSTATERQEVFAHWKRYFVAETPKWNPEQVRHAAWHVLIQWVEALRANRDPARIPVHILNRVRIRHNGQESFHHLLLQ
jgi:hypothetical protein